MVGEGERGRVGNGWGTGAKSAFGLVVFYLTAWLQHSTWRQY